jgi:hypothetical protein
MMKRTIIVTFALVVVFVDHLSNVAKIFLNGIVIYSCEKKKAWMISKSVLIRTANVWKIRRSRILNKTRGTYVSI